MDLGLLGVTAKGVCYSKPRTDAGRLKEMEMSSDQPPWEGGCRCGKVRFRLNAPPLLTMACHCRGCQRMTGGPFSLSVAEPADAFEVLAGEPVIAGLHGSTHHYFCGWCMSWLFTRPEGIDSLVNVRTTMLDEPASFPPFIETFTREKLPWASTPAKHSYSEFPPMSAYDALMREFRGGR